MTLFCPECGEGYDDSQSVCPADGVRLYAVHATKDPLIGEVLEGRFRIDSMLGSGGMGAVYRAVQTSVGREVAIKVLHAELDDDQAALARFFREAKFVSELTHPSIVRVIDFGQDTRLHILYLVMELIEGPTLDEVIRGARLDVNFALEIAYQICGGLTEPHASQVVHRDLKPANLFVNPVSDGSIQVKICDFGIARALTRATRLTMEGGICGTPTYMSPEQATDQALDSRTDLYSLGVILYQMLTGWLPFSAPSSLQLMLKHVQEVPPPFSEVLSAAPLPRSVEQLVRDLMQKSPDARPASARAVRDRIGRIRAELGLPAVQLNAGAETQGAPFAKWIVAVNPSPGAPASQPDSSELAYAPTGAMSTTDTELLGPSMTQTLLLDGATRQTPTPSGAPLHDASDSMALERVSTGHLGLANEIAPTGASPVTPQQAPAGSPRLAPSSNPSASTPKPPQQRTAPQPIHTVESAPSAAERPASKASPILIAIFALVLGALLLASIALGYIWMNTQQTSTRPAPNTTETVEAAAEETVGDEAVVDEAVVDEAAVDEAAVDEAAAKKQPGKASAAEAPAKAPTPKSADVAPTTAVPPPKAIAKTPAVRPPSPPPHPEPAASPKTAPTDESKGSDSTDPVLPEDTPLPNLPPKDSTEASDRLDAIFGNQNLRKD